MGITVAVAAVWAALAAAHPTTTYHLAPLILAAAWPVTWASRHAPTVGATVRAALIGLAGALAVTAVLAAAGWLAGPTVFGRPGAAVESVMMAGLGAAAGAGWALRRGRRAARPAGRPRPASPPGPRYRAVLDGRVLADSDRTRVMDGAVYFPPEAVRWEGVTASRLRTVCPYKGVASWFSVSVAGRDYRNAAWTYRRPFPFARTISGHVAFWGPVHVEQLPMPSPRLAVTGERAGLPVRDHSQPGSEQPPAGR